MTMTEVTVVLSRKYQPDRTGADVREVRDDMHNLLEYAPRFIEVFSGNSWIEDVNDIESAKCVYAYEYSDEQAWEAFFQTLAAAVYQTARAEGFSRASVILDLEEV